MTKILNLIGERGALLFSGKRGTDTYPVIIPPGEAYHSCRLTILNSLLISEAEIASQPEPGQVEKGEVAIKWKCNPNSFVRYQVEVFSKPIVPSPGGDESVTRQMTGFLPSKDAFHFINLFPPVPDVVIRTPLGNLNIGDASKGLCGGMVYAALDYFNSGLGIPADSQPPAQGQLFDYIVRRLLTSFDLPFGIIQYVELMNPRYPDGVSTAGRFGTTPYGRAWRMIRQEWPIIKGKIDSGQACPLGLVLIKSADLTQLGQNHQVMVYGYDVIGDELILNIYDPNYLQRDDITLKLDLSDPKHAPRVTYSTGMPVVCFFATNYAFSMPPGDELSQGRILLFEDRDFGGRVEDIENAHPDLSIINDLNFDERTSSMAVLSGNWCFYKNPRFADPFMHGNKPLVLGPGSYSWVEDFGIKNDDISSLKVVSDPPNH
jgi:hypothetical protein